MNAPGSGEALDRVPCGYARVGADGVVQAANRPLLAMVGRDAGEVVGQPFGLLLSPAARIFLQTHLLPMVRLHGAAEEVFLVLRSRAGEDVQVLTHAVAGSEAAEPAVDFAFVRVRERHRYEDELKRARAVAEASRASLAAQAQALAAANGRLEEQATELEEMLEALREASDATQASEARFRAAMDAMPGGIALVDAPTGALLLFNDTACSGLGYSREEFARMHIADIEVGWSEARMEVLLRRLEAAPGGIQFRSRHRTRDGELRDVLVSLRALGDGQVCSVWVDITEQTRAEAEAQAQRELLDTVLGNVPLLVGVRDAGGALVWANRAWRRVLGWPPVPERTPAWHRGAGGHRQRMTAADGGALETAWTHVPLSDGRAIAIGQDVSAEAAADEERAGLEEQLRQAQKMEAVGKLAGGVAHDFNNLLMVIRGFAILLEGGVSEASPERVYLAEIRRAAERATSLTQQLLAFGRKQALQPRTLDLGAVVTGAGALLRRLVREDVELAFRVAPQVSAVRADPLQVEQVLMNLVVNARDAVPGGGRVEVAVEDRAVAVAFAGTPDAVPPGRYVALSVADTGQGMDAAVLARVFEPFFTTKEVGQGTGLGLSTVYGIVKQSDGYVVCESAPGRGSTFTVFLPALSEAPSPVPAAAPEPAQARGSATVLLVEDDDAVRGLVRAVLHRAGYTVLEAGDGLAALEVAAGHAGRIDVLLTDAVMPRMGGPELVGALRRERPGVLALLMSGYPGDDVAAHGVPEGVDFLQKPLDPAELLRRLGALTSEG